MVERSVRRLCIALNMFAEASAITEMRLADCRRRQESQALSENMTTTTRAVVRITALSSADTVNLLSIMAPKKCERHLAQKG